MANDHQLPEPNSLSPITDAVQLGAVFPNYTWRKGGTKDPLDNHLWLTLGSADDLLVPEDDALIEIDPVKKHVKFWATTELLEGISFEENSLHGSSIQDGTLSGSKLEPGIVIDGSITKLTTKRNINGVLFDGTANVINYGVCSTAAGTAAKTVNIANFQLIAGSKVVIKFANTNTNTSPTLNVSDTGAKQIYYHGAQINSSLLTNDRIFTLVYDGTRYNVVGDIYVTSPDEKVKIVPVTNNNVYRLIGTDQTKQITTTVNSFEGVTFNPSTKVLSVQHVNSDSSGAWNQINDQSTSIINATSTNSLVGLITRKTTGGVFTISSTTNELIASYTDNDLVEDDYDGVSYQVNLLDKNGNSKFPGNITAPRLIGTADVATRAINDNNGDPITSTYATKSQLSQYLRTSGGTLTGVLKVPPIDKETNVIVSTCGWVNNQIDIAVQEVLDTVVGGSGQAGTISDLSSRLTTAERNITNLTTKVNALDSNYVKFSGSQSLTTTQKTTARTNIGAYSSTGGTISGNVTITGTLTDNNNIRVTSSSVTVGTNPSAAQRRSVQFTDKTGGNAHSQVSSVVNTNGSVTTELSAKSNSNTSTYGTISITANSNGSYSTSAPNPPTGSNNTSIATTSWVNKAISNALNDNATIASKTYSNINGPSTLTNVEQGLMYFGKIVPSDALQSWRATFVIRVSTSYDSYNACALVELTGVGQNINYKYTVVHNSQSTISFAGINYRPATTAAINSGNGHYIGLSLYESTNPTSTAYARTYDVKALVADHCTVSLPTNIGNASVVGITSSTHGSNVLVNTKQTGFYYSSTVDYGDRVGLWDRVANAGTGGITSNSVVAENENGQLIKLFNGTTITSTPIKPESLMYYNGSNVSANQVNTTLGSLYSIHRFNLSIINSTSLTNTTLYIEGTIDITKWLFRCERIVSEMSNSSKQYVLLGYSNNTTCTLTNNHIVYGKIGKDSFKPISPKPLITNPAANSNDTTIATTSWVNSKVSGNLINPSINSDVEDETYINLLAYKGSFTKTSLPSSPYTNSVNFYDGSGSEDDANLLGWIGQDTSSSEISTYLGTNHPTSDTDTNIKVGFKKSGSTWKAFATAPQPPSLNDSSDAIATTKYVQDNMTGVCAYCACSTAAGTVAKTGTVSNFRLVAGATVIVDFNNGNTATNPTLNINGTGAKNLVSMGARLGKLAAHTCLMFVYTGSEYRTVGITLNNPTVYGSLTIID